MVRNSLFVLFMAFLVFSFSLIIKRHHHVMREGHCLYSVKRSLSADKQVRAKHYHPQCTLYGGHYLAQQCDPNTRVCWCVTRNGKKLPGTETPDGKQPEACRLNSLTSWFRKLQE